MICRLANSNDLSVLEIMFKEIVKNMHNHGITIWNEYYPFEEFEIDIQKNQLYLLVDNNEIFATFVLYPSDTSDCFAWKSKDKEAMLLNRLGVNVKYLKQGVAFKVLDEAKKIAKKKNFKYLRLAVVDSNIPAINLYKKYGFKKVDGIYKEYIKERDITLVEYGFELKI